MILILKLSYNVQTEMYIYSYVSKKIAMPTKRRMVAIQIITVVNDYTLSVLISI